MVGGTRPTGPLHRPEFQDARRAAGYCRSQTLARTARPGVERGAAAEQSAIRTALVVALQGFAGEISPGPGVLRQYRPAAGTSRTRRDRLVLQRKLGMEPRRPGSRGHG